MKQQGKRTDLTSRQDVDKSKSADQISDTDSGRQVQRYIRLTWLLPELLKLVDAGKIALTPAVYLSYLSAQQQRWVLEGMKRSDCIPSVSQAHRLKEKSQAGTLTPEAVAVIMGKEKANQKEKLKIPMERVRRFFPASYTTVQIEEEIVKMCETRYRTVTMIQQ